MTNDDDLHDSTINIQNQTMASYLQDLLSVARVLFRYLRLIWEQNLRHISLIKKPRKN